ncbi:MAG: response regulator transcription factor [Ferruginibacter sp.]|nr:response regulator transcription factor [Ferruginibacter sp.]
MITAIIIDDEQNNIENLSLLLEKHCPDIVVTATALSAVDAEKKIKELKPQLIFLDIQMPGRSGFQLLEEIPLPRPEIIFVTAYDEYAVQAFKFSAVDYLLKPLNVNDLKMAAEKAVERIKSKKQNLHLENMLHFLQKQQEKDEHRIALPSLKETRFVFTKEIVYCESSNNYTSFYLANGETIMVSKPIFEFADMLNEYGFLRCHQSYLVNKKYITSLVKEDGGYLLLANKKKVPVSRSKKDEIKKELEK